MGPRDSSLALALANSKNGFLLIDEAENGIHHSMQRDLWKMVLQTALKNNVHRYSRLRIAGTVCAALPKQ